MPVYKSKFSKIRITSHAAIVREARRQYHILQKRTPRRQAYVRSAYFSKDKIFINQYWDHLKQKHPADQVRRLQLYNCALDLIRYSTISPQTIYSNMDKEHALHRFEGIANDGVRFYVQIKENKRTNRKDFMSCFPAK
jgi:hypothetical protein